MTFVIDRKSLCVLLVRSRQLLLTAAVVLLAYCVFNLAGGWMFQNNGGRQFDRLLLRRPPAVRETTPGAIAEGLVGRITIPRLGLSVLIAEGADGATLSRAVGHLPGTALPGQSGNVVLSGHRDTYFRPLRKIEREDVITVSTLAGEYRYRVVSTKVVSPTDVSVLTAGVRQTLTLITCYPFYFIGPAPDRFIVQAERIA